MVGVTSLNAWPRRAPYFAIFVIAEKSPIHFLTSVADISLSIKNDGRGIRKGEKGQRWRGIRKGEKR